MVIEHEDDLTTHPIGFTRDAGTLYWISSVGRDKAALLARDWQTGTDRLVAEHPKADISRVMANPLTHVVEAAGAQHLTLDWIPLDERVASDLKHLQGALPGEVEVADRTLDDNRWIVAAGAAETPTTYHLYDRGSGSITELFATRPELKVYRLAPMRGEVIRARDGLELVSYLTLPAGALASSQGAAAHGAAGARRALGARRVRLQPATTSGWPTAAMPCCRSTSAARPASARRSSTPATSQWGRKMHDDLLDAVAWAVKEGIADPARVAIMGGSYGGYATLAGLAFTPDVFCCGVDIVGPSNLETLLATIPPYWARVLREPRPARRRSAHRGGAQAAQGALAAPRRRQRSPGRC